MYGCQGNTFHVYYVTVEGSGLTSMLKGSAWRDALEGVPFQGILKRNGSYKVKLSYCMTESLPLVCSESVVRNRATIATDPKRWSQWGSQDLNLKDRVHLETAWLWAAQ